MIVIHLTQYTVVTRYASVSVCTHLSEWGEPKNINDGDDDNDDDDNAVDDNDFDFISQCIFFIFTVPTIFCWSKIRAIFQDSCQFWGNSVNIVDNDGDGVSDVVVYGDDDDEDAGNELMFSA